MCALINRRAEMKRGQIVKQLSIFLLVLLGSGVAGAQNQSPTDNGYWWADQSRVFKLAFADGYAAAMTHASGIEAFRCVADRNGGILPANPPSNEVLNASVQSTEPLDFSELLVGQLTDGVDDFYKDFRNKSIDIRFAFQYVRDELKGKSSVELEQELNKARASSVQK
jgi:hypothetical protein